MIRIKKVITPFLISMACLAGGNSISQQLRKEIKLDQYRAIHWTMEDGLPWDGSNVMIKDIKGFLWVGTLNGGLCRFDGASFKKYFPDLNKRGVLYSDRIHSFAEDSLNNIWIGTDEGLSRYDIKADTFTNFVSHVSKSSNQRFLPFWSTKDKLYCIEAGLHIVVYNIYSFKKDTLLALKESDKIQLKNIVLDTITNSLWMLNYDDAEEKGLLNINLKDGTRQYYSWLCFRNISNHNHGSEAMQYDPKRNSIWINSPDGLLEFSIKDKQFHLPDAFNEFIKLKDYHRFVGVDIDLYGRVWLATTPKGILIYDPETGQVRQLFSDKDLQKKAGDANLQIYCDRDGIIWTSNWWSYGIYEILPYNPPFKRFTANPKMKDSLSNNSIQSIFPVANDEIWIGTSDGLNIFDPKTHKFQVLRQKDLPELSGKFIAPVYVDTVSQKAWISSAATINWFDIDLYEMDLKTRKCMPVVFRDGTKLLDTFSISLLWFWPYKNGLIFYDEKHGIFEIKQNSLFADLIIPIKKPLYRMTLAKERFIYLRNAGDGKSNYTFENKNGKWIKIPHLLDSLEWTTMFYNKKDQTYWVGLKYELIHYDKNFWKIRAYSQDNGYNGAVSIIADNSGDIWFTDILNRINRLDTTIGVITYISDADGYQRQKFDWLGPIAIDGKGDLYFGAYNKDQTTGGLDIVYPEKYSSAITSSVYLRSLSINQKPFYLSTGVNNLEELSLRYNQNTISIETGIIDYYANGKGHIRYKLKGGDNEEDWQYGPAYYSIRYEKLSPGKYELVLQASNAANEFNSPVKTLVINVSPPFWQTWWFWITAIICIVTIFYNAIRWRMKQKFRKQLERSEKERQMAELKQKATELEMQALRAQMNPHFIFNSLNSINRFILQNERTQASEYLTKFSKLVRMILQNSQASLITLDSELESLGLYLNLEALRFNYHFDYKISVPKELDSSALQVPPLILQPYVENAIWHGLMHKEEKGQLEIKITEEDDHLYFKITDNGIGRKKASELASKSATKHKSMGLRITAHRIAMMQNSNGVESPVTINDLANTDGSAAGTEVVIKMPVIYD
jgi:streptogramin lyase